MLDKECFTRGSIIFPQKDPPGQRLDVQGNEVDVCDFDKLGFQKMPSSLERAA